MKTLLMLSLLLSAIPTFADNSGVIRVVKGEVSVTSGKTGQTTPAQVDQNVTVKDVIVTGATGWATVIMDDGSAFKVGPSSSVEIRKYISSLSQSETILRLVKGRARFAVTKKAGFKKEFEVHTPSTVCGVRGTDFLVEYSAEQESKVTTFEGVVEFKGLEAGEGKAVRVAAGMSARREKEKVVGEASSVPKNELGALKKEFGEVVSHERRERSSRGRKRH